MEISKQYTELPYYSGEGCCTFSLCVEDRNSLYKHHRQTWKSRCFIQTDPYALRECGSGIESQAVPLRHDGVSVCGYQPARLETCESANRGKILGPHSYLQRKPPKRQLLYGFKTLGLFNLKVRISSKTTKTHERKFFIRAS